MTLTIADIMAIPRIGAKNIETLPVKLAIGISTDSRTVKRGDAFVAIRGEKFDGHTFVPQAFERGAVVAIVDKQADVKQFGEKPIIVVTETTKGLGQLAKLYRKKFTIPFIVIAGSNGKTTTKDMVGEILSSKFSVVATEGNMNNHIGVPLTLFRVQKKHDIAVLELGSNHFGELAYLCDIVQPTHGLVTNIGREHLEFFGNLNGVAQEEGTVFDAVRAAGTGIVNVDDPFLMKRAKTLKRKITYGFTNTAARVRGTFLGLDTKARPSFSVKIRGKKGMTVRLPVPGKHLAANALAAVAVGYTMDVPLNDIRRRLERFTSPSKRMEVVTVGGVTIINDTYNANPDSMVAALETLRAMQTKGKKIAVLADMLELGDRAEREHRALGPLVNQCADFLLTYGFHARCIYEESTLGMKFHYDQKNVLSEYVAELVSPGDVVLVKGSRGMNMEDVVVFLRERLGARWKRSTAQRVSLVG